MEGARFSFFLHRGGLRAARPCRPGPDRRSAPNRRSGATGYNSHDHSAARGAPERWERGAAASPHWARPAAGARRGGAGGTRDAANAEAAYVSVVHAGGGAGRRRTRPQRRQQYTRMRGGAFPAVPALAPPIPPSLAQLTRSQLGRRERGAAHGRGGGRGPRKRARPRSPSLTVAARPSRAMRARRRMVSGGGGVAGRGRWRSGARLGRARAQPSRKEGLQAAARPKPSRATPPSPPHHDRVRRGDRARDPPPRPRRRVRLLPGRHPGL